MNVTPRATMRLQFNTGFTFDDAAALVGYMHRLGISHVYASPILAARAGSAHGYDVIDPTRISDEIGGRAGLERLVAVLRRPAEAPGERGGSALLPPATVILLATTAVALMAWLRGRGSR